MAPSKRSSFPETLRIGVVSFLNAWPLTDALGEVFPKAEILALYPSQLEAMLVQDELDLTLLSSITYPQYDPKVRIIGDIGVGSRGSVRSVNLFFHPALFARFADSATALEIPPGSRLFSELITSVRSLQLDPVSRTSNELLLTLLAENNYLAQCQWSFPGSDSPVEKPAQRLFHSDATLLIGDAALDLSTQYHYVDLGAWWYQHTETAFVYACWQMRQDLGDDSVYQQITERLHHSYSLGKLKKTQFARRYILQREASSSKMDLHSIEAYLEKNIQYEFDDIFMRGLQRFYTSLWKRNIIDHIPKIR